MSITETTQDEASLLPLGRIFGSPASKVLDFLLTNQQFDYSESDISKLSGLSPRTTQRVLPFLLEEKVVKRTRKSGKAYMYEANLESKRAKALLDYINATRKETLERDFS